MIWIIAICAIVLSVGNIALTIHTLLCTNRYYRGLDEWAKAIDKYNLDYIKQEFAKLKFENNLIIQEEKDD